MPLWQLGGAAAALKSVPDAPMQLFSARQKGQLDVYGLWGCLRGQLLTDDSFVFNRVLSRLKDSVSRLQDATPDDDEALTRLKVRAQSLSTSGCRALAEVLGSPQSVHGTGKTAPTWLVSPVQARLQGDAEERAAPREEPAAQVWLPGATSAVLLCRLPAQCVSA